MRLVNHTLLYLSGSLILVLSVWAVLFYVTMMDEVYDSIDDGLENYKILIIKKAEQDSSILNLSSFDERNYAIQPVSKTFALQAPQQFRDTSMYMEAEADFEMVRMLTTYFKDRQDRYYQLKILSSMVEEDDLMEDLVYALVWLFLAVIGSAFLIDKYVLQKIWRPFYLLKDGLDRFDLDSQIPFEKPETTVTEFKSLNDSVERLLVEHAKVYKSQKELIENASHELQTPLAVAISQLELLMNESVEDPTLNLRLDAVMEQLHRIKRLNKSLLLLSKIENKQFVGTQPIQMNAKLKELIELLEPLSSYHDVTIRMEESHEDLVWNLHEDLGQMLLTNVLKNAIIHNYPGGKVFVKLMKDAIEIANTGVTESLDPNRIFDRFTTGPSQAVQKTGLGLSIAFAIAAQHGMKITYSFANGLHTFRIVVS
jgi:signal transduction histidine kinase